MTIKSVNAPAIGQAGVKRLWAFARSKPMSKDSTLFEAGYEQCKADLREKLAAEVAVPEEPERTGQSRPMDPWWKQWVR